MMRMFIISLSLLVLLWTACGKGYFRSDFFMITEKSVEKLRPVENYYLEDTHLIDDVERRFQIAGAGNLLIASYIHPDPEVLDTALRIFEFTPDLEYRLYIDLPVELEVDSLDIAGKSICFIVGQYELRDYLKTFRCGEGYLAIDSIKKQKLFTRLNGIYYNSAGDSLLFRGKITAPGK